jgi:hypothetical protein
MVRLRPARLPHRLRPSLALHHAFFAVKVARLIADGGDLLGRKALVQFGIGQHGSSFVLGQGFVQGAQKAMEPAQPGLQRFSVLQQALGGIEFRIVQDTGDFRQGKVQFGVVMVQGTHDFEAS